MVTEQTFTYGENHYLRYLFGPGVGGFFSKLYDAMATADSNNLELLRQGFPQEVAGFLSWTRGDLRERAQQAGRMDSGIVAFPSRSTYRAKPLADCDPGDCTDAA